jgi:hypothetical protein
MPTPIGWLIAIRLEPPRAETTVAGDCPNGSIQKRVQFRPFLLLLLLALGVSLHFGITAVAHVIPSTPPALGSPLSPSADLGVAEMLHDGHRCVTVALDDHSILSIAIAFASTSSSGWLSCVALISSPSAISPRVAFLVHCSPWC